MIFVSTKQIYQNLWGLKWSLSPKYSVLFLRLRVMNHDLLSLISTSTSTTYYQNFLREDFLLKNIFENLTFCKKGYNSLSANVMMLPITWFQGGNDIFLLSLMGHSVKCNYVVTGMVYSNLVSRNIKGGPQRACFGKEWKNATNFLLPSWLVRVPNEPKPPYFVEVWRQMCPSPTRRLPTYYTTKYLIFKSNMI